MSRGGLVSAFIFLLVCPLVSGFQRFKAGVPLVVAAPYPDPPTAESYPTPQWGVDADKINRLCRFYMFILRMSLDLQPEKFSIDELRHLSALFPVVIDGSKSRFADLVRPKTKPAATNIGKEAFAKFPADLVPDVLWPSSKTAAAKPAVVPPQAEKDAQLAKVREYGVHTHFIFGPVWDLFDTDGAGGGFNVAYLVKRVTESVHREVWKRVGVELLISMKFGTRHGDPYIAAEGPAVPVQIGSVQEYSHVELDMSAALSSKDKISGKSLPLETVQRLPGAKAAPIDKGSVWSLLTVGRITMNLLNSHTVAPGLDFGANWEHGDYGWKFTLSKADKEKIANDLDLTNEAETVARSLVGDVNKKYNGGFPPYEAKFLEPGDLIKMYPEHEPILRYLKKKVDLSPGQQYKKPESKPSSDPAKDPPSGAVSLSAVVSVATGAMVFFF